MRRLSSSSCRQPGRCSPPDDANPFSDDVLTDLATRTGTITITEPRFRVRISAADDGTVAVTALSLDRYDDSVTDFRRTLFAGGFVILLLVAAVIWLLTTRAVRPVTRMAATATRIGQGELQTDVDAPSGSQETVDLAVALELMLTELRSTIEDREHAVQNAQEARDAMRRFLADVSHELRTPLTALKGYSDLYAGGMLDDPGALDRAMSRIGDESERLNGLVTNMLQLARDTPSGEPVESFDAAHVVEVVATDLRAAHPNVGIHFEIAPRARTDITGRPARFHQAILNLGTNACRHTAPGTSVEFVLRSTDTQLVVEVIDHGAGIEPREADKIFLPFYRPEASRKRDSGGGAGLGLAITQQIIEQHDGTITVEPTAGGGATFIVAVPQPRA